jgi:hypothetical protein
VDVLQSQRYYINFFDPLSEQQASGEKPRKGLHTKFAHTIGFPVQPLIRTEVQFQARQRRGPVVRGDNKVAELRKEYNRDPKILSSRETIDLLLGNLLQKVT